MIQLVENARGVLEGASRNGVQMALTGEQKAMLISISMGFAIGVLVGELVEVKMEKHKLAKMALNYGNMAVGCLGIYMAMNQMIDPFVGMSIWSVNAGYAADGLVRFFKNREWKRRD